MPDRGSAPRKTKLIGRAINDAVVRVPWLWPLLRRPLRGFFDRQAATWDDHSRAGSVEHLAALAAGLVEVKPEPERVLDIGTGTGEAALLAAREFPRSRVRGVDLSEEMIAVARAKTGLDPEGRIAFKVGDAAQLPWAEESFDLIIQLNMPPFFSEVRRVLRPGGWVVVAASWGDQTPFYTSPGSLRSGFARVGITEQATGAAGPGDFWAGRLAR